MAYRSRPSVSDVEAATAEIIAAAHEAEKEFIQLSELYPGAISALRKWWERHYMKAGHTRLGYVVMGRELK